MTMVPVVPFRHVIVIGGGIAGLLAARVVSGYSERVTVVERDYYPNAPNFRAGTPQARQVHTFLLRGQQIIEALFPGFREKILAAGACEHDFASETLYFYGERCPQLAPGLCGWNASRMLVEWQIRHELKAFPVTIMEGCAVKGLLYEDHAVRGVKYQERGSAAAPIRELSGDLVIDTTGSSSAVLHWLEEIGYASPHETVVNPHIGYATRFYQRPANIDAWSLIAIQATQQSRRAGALMEVEGGRWMVLVAGSGKDYPPNDPEEYLEFAHSLPEQELYTRIKEATPLSHIYGYRPIGNRFRHFDRIKMPRGFVAMGDAVCSFNPIYGQGMTIAILESQALERCLAHWHRKKNGEHDFQRRIAKVLAAPWLLSTVADSSPEDRKTIRDKIAHWYVSGYVIPAIPKDKMVQRTFIEVLHMLKSPNALLTLSIIFRMFRLHLSGVR
ncbi:MAG: FAD-dependent monooxygenase [Ktedonobacteraceae bacterium]|nr:FAD-dependent monooxygenase [Ktedonobacteraceae bacterium]